MPVGQREVDQGYRDIDAGQVVDLRNDRPIRVDKRSDRYTPAAFGFRTLPREGLDVRPVVRPRQASVRVGLAMKQGGQADDDQVNSPGDLENEEGTRRGHHLGRQPDCCRRGTYVQPARRPDRDLDAFRPPLSKHPGHDERGARTWSYLWPAECDLMAQLAGITLERRLADWSGAPFTSDSEAHVSVWRTPS